MADLAALGLQGGHFRNALAHAKQALDGTGIMNPGVLIDPLERKVGVRGALAG